MCGKRSRGCSLNRREITSPVQAKTVPTTTFCATKTTLDFIIQHLADDARPYVEITISGIPLLGLLDSGSSRSLVSETTACTVANGDICYSTGYITTPVTFDFGHRFLEIRGYSPHHYR